MSMVMILFQYNYEYKRNFRKHNIFNIFNFNTVDNTRTSKLRKFTHTTIEVVIKYGLTGIVLYGFIGGLYFAMTQGIKNIPICC